MRIEMDLDEVLDLKFVTLMGKYLIIKNKEAEIDETLNKTQVLGLAIKLMDIASELIDEAKELKE